MNILKFEPIANEIKKLVEQSFTDKEISEKLNISRRRVGYIREVFNIKPFFRHNNYKSKEDRIKGYMIRNVKYSSKRRNLDFDLDYKDITLPRYCPLLNIELNYNNQKSHKILNLGNDYENLSFNDISRATVDRIDNSKGYVKGNIIILSRLANAMKNEANFEQLETFSTNILNLINFYKNQGARGNITDIFFNNEELSLDS
jgi:hypothetical protein